MRFWVLGFGFWVWGFGFWVLEFPGLVFGVLGLVVCLGDVDWGVGFELKGSVVGA